MKLSIPIWVSFIELLRSVEWVDNVHYWNVNKYEYLNEVNEAFAIHTWMYIQYSSNKISNVSIIVQYYLIYD